jgi:GAF domain-containing protein
MLCTEMALANRYVSPSYLTAASVTPETSVLNPDVENVAVKSPDPNLTALVQLGPLKLDCDRSFLSLIDGKTQYIIAESTKTTSLGKSNDVDDNGNNLYLGAILFEAAWGVCPDTMNVFTDDTGSLAFQSDNIVANRSGYIIRDFQADPRYTDRPYIKSWPFMRSYAEVPIISPLGYVIGGYCVVDNKLRTFDDGTLAVLAEISSTST